MVSPFWRFSSTLWIFSNSNFCQKCSDVFAAPFVQVSQNTKIFQNKKHYTAKLKFVWNTPSYVKMQHENIVRKSHVVLGLFADENRHFSFAGQKSSPIWMLYEQFFYRTQNIHTCSRIKNFVLIPRIGENLGPIHRWSIYGIMVDSAQRCPLKTLQKHAFHFLSKTCFFIF